MHQQNFSKQQQQQYHGSATMMPPQMRPHATMQQNMMANQMRATTPTANFRQRVDGQRHPMMAQGFDNGLGFNMQGSNSNRILSDRVDNMHFKYKQGFMNGNNNSSLENGMLDGPDEGEYKPATTVHDVIMIPNYFSSGEEDQAQFPH